MITERKSCNLLPCKESMTMPLMHVCASPRNSVVIGEIKFVDC